MNISIKNYELNKKYNYKIIKKYINRVSNNEIYIGAGNVVCLIWLIMLHKKSFNKDTKL